MIERTLQEHFDLALIWNKGRVIPNFDPAVWRWDRYGTPIKRSEYGRISEHGWEIDHTIPYALGGSENFSNKQPLHWKNNRVKSDKCSIFDVL